MYKYRRKELVFWNINRGFTKMPSYYMIYNFYILQTFIYYFIVNIIYSLYISICCFKIQKKITYVYGCIGESVGLRILGRTLCKKTPF